MDLPNSEQKEIEEKFNYLFNRWEESNPEEYKGHFKRDGIVHPPTYYQQKQKILFICKEGNKTNDEEAGKSGDYREWWKKDPLYRTFSRRIGSWAYGILNDLDSVEGLSDDQKRDGLYRIAFMNLKKIAGGSESSFPDIQHYIDEDRQFIIDEINLIGPDLIIGSLGSGWVSIWQYLFANELLKLSSTQFVWNEIPIVHFYHPSARMADKVLYDKLRNLLKMLAPPL